MPTAGLIKQPPRKRVHVLGAGLDAHAEAISDAVDGLSFEPRHDPDALNAARAASISARDRMGEELGWLPETSAAEGAPRLRVVEEIAVAPRYRRLPTWAPAFAGEPIVSLLDGDECRTLPG